MSRHQPERLAAFAAAVAHDLNEELTVILNAVTAVLEHTPAGHPLREHLETLERAVLRCGGITDALLALTRRKGAQATIPLHHFLLSD